MSITDGKRGEIQTLVIETPKCHAEISLLGGQIISWKPTGFDEILYLSPQAVFKPGKAIRGGGPICWPWFCDQGTPKHGVARDRIWNIEKKEVVDGVAHVVLSLVAEDYNGISATIETYVGDKLTQTLRTVNGTKPIEYSVAIHNYWTVGDITKVSVTGLEDVQFIETAKGVKPHSEKPLMIDGPIDRLYQNTEGPFTLTDPVLGRKLTLERTGSKTAIVWNIWEGAKGLADMPDDDYKRYLCIETANAHDNTIHLEPKQESVLSYTATVSKL